MRRYFKEFLILIYIFAGYESYFERLSDIGLSFAGIAYVFLFSLILFSLVATSHIPWMAIRIAFAVAIYISAVFFDVYEKITSNFLSYNAFISLFKAQEFIGAVIFQHFVPIVIAMLMGLLLFAGIVLQPRRAFIKPVFLTVLAPVAMIVLLTTILFIRGGEGAKALPSAFTLMAYGNLGIYEAANQVVGVRKNVEMERAEKKIAFDIVYIVDESISANYLDINTKNGVLTNLNKEYDDFEIFNYGYAASISNCSYDTNSTLRYGGTRKEYIKINSTMPSMWAYAKKAGLKTVYIDTQNEEYKFQNGMDESELNFIDEFIQFDEVPIMYRDITAAKKLVDYLNNNTQEFIFINKTGAHFPVHDKYPDDFMLYRPALKRGQYMNISYTGSREGFGGSDEEWVKYRNAYKNTLLWNVGEFFSTLFSSATMDNAVVIYTSDHGQDLHERGNPGHNTHCGDDPNIEEGLVPLVVMQGNSLDVLNWQKHYKGNKNKSSHYNIFPTLLSLMAYDSYKVKEVYGNSLDTMIDDPFTFNILFSARLGRKPVWREINLDNIVEP